MVAEMKGCQQTVEEYVKYVKRAEKGHRRNAGILPGNLHGILQRR